MALGYTSAIAALLNNGEKQVLPISMANLIELSKDKTNFGQSAQSVQDALSYLAGSFEHANNAAQTAQDNAYTYVGEEIGKLDVAAVGSATDAGHDKFISYIYQENGKIKAFAQDMTAANVAYAGTDGGSTNVADELTRINSTIASNLTATTLKLVKVNGTSEEDAKVVSADGSTYKLKQGSKDVASFNIEKDSFVKTGEVVRGELKDGKFIEKRDGEYFIKLEIRTHDDTGEGAVEHTLYIPAESLVDAYTADNGTGDSNTVTITVNQDKNTISATIKTGGVGTTELADSAVTTEKIAEKNVTKNKLADDVQTSLGKADSAVQKIETGSTHGTIKVDNKDVNVNLTGLKNVATSGKAVDVSVDTTSTNNKIAALVSTGDTTPSNVQETLEFIAGKVKGVADGAVTSLITSVSDKGHDAGNLVTISMTPTSSAKGDVTVALTHNLGGVAVLDYESKNTSSAISETFYNAIQ